MFPNSIKPVLESGIIGELAFASPIRAKAVLIKSADEKKNIFGRALTYVSGATGTPLTGDQGINPAPAVVQVGGSGKFAGFLAHPKASYATVFLNTTAADLQYAPNETIVDCLEMGEVFAHIENTGKPTDAIAYDADGKFYAVADPANVPAGQTLVPNATLRMFTVATATGGAVIAFTN